MPRLGEGSIMPRVVCPACRRSIAMVANGLPRSHRNSNGDPCPGSGNSSGICGVCGRETPLERDGTLRPHKEIRVRRSLRKSPDGWMATEPETYSTKLDCSGAGELPEVS